MGSSYSTHKVRIRSADCQLSSHGLVYKSHCRNIFALIPSLILTAVMVRPRPSHVSRPSLVFSLRGNLAQHASHVGFVALKPWILIAAKVLRRRCGERLWVCVGVERPDGATHPHAVGHLRRTSGCRRRGQVGLSRRCHPAHAHPAVSHSAGAVVVAGVGGEKWHGGATRPRPPCCDSQHWAAFVAGVGGVAWRRARLWHLIG